MHFERLVVRRLYVLFVVLLLSVLQKMRVLNVAHNRLWRLNKGIGQLRELRQLFIDHNELSDLPGSVLQLFPAVEVFELHDNPWSFAIVRCLDNRICKLFSHAL